jgi:hypothetical protein
MAQLTYWYCQCLDDADAYSIVTKTKKEAIARLAERGDGADCYAPPEKRTIDYRDAFDLFYWATSEGGGRGCGSSGK